MASKPRRASRNRLKVVGHIGTHEEIVNLLSEALVRAQDDETLAIALVEIKREGEVETHTVGDSFGFRHSLVAGASYLLRDLTSEEDDV
jgi:hypothetical protein